MNDIAPDATTRASFPQPTHPPSLSLLAPSLHLRRPTRSRRAAAPPRPSSARAAGAGGSSNTMLKLYTDSGEAGLKVDPFVVVVLSISFIASIFFLHIAAKIVRAFTK
ncbi:Protein transport protein Sec61 subunit beta [Saitozyma sp. JCM 24511]|nr:Protein transport protein Sec61 subunit beta [Saitozyma sp. JCM 24511]